MQRSRRAAFTMALLMCASGGFGQNSQTILPYDSPAASLLQSMLLEQGKEPLSTAGPFSIGELRMALDRVDPAALSEAGRRAYGTVKAALATRSAAKPMALGFAAHPSASVESYYRANPSPDGTEWQEGYNQRLPLLSVPMDVWIGDDAYADFDLALRQNHDALDPALVPDNRLNWTLDFDRLDYEIPQRAFAGFGGDGWSFTIGRDRFSWGNGHGGNLLLSDSADYQDFARMTLFWPRLKYTGLWIMLYASTDQYRAPSSGAAAITTDPAWYPRNFFLHRLDFTLWDRLSISLNEGILIGGIDPDLVYFNPLMIFHDLFRWGFASSICALEVDWNPWRFIDVYGQAAYNQIQTPYELIKYGTGASDSPGAAAYLGGARGRVPLWQGYLDAGGEAALVQPWMYIRENELISYEWWRYQCSNVTNSTQWVSAPIGYFTGADAVTGSLWASYDVPGLFSVGLGWTHVVKGEQDFSTTYVETAQTVALVTPTGIAQVTDIIHARATADPFPFLRLAADLYWLGVANNGHVEGAWVDDLQASASATLHWDL
jgi:hypothetical protein